MKPVTTITALEDNYIFLVEYQKNKAFAVDPSQSTPVIKAIEKMGVHLSTILITHHHYDHTGGVADLKKRYNCQTIAPQTLKTKPDRIIKDKDTITLDDINIEVIATPGHTKTSVCYYLPPTENIPQPLVFTGDTLFTGGCGRVFETDYTTMYNSLQKLKNLPQNTIVYPGHDYTKENYQFAQSINPNKTIENRLQQLKQTQNQFTTIEQEQKTNIFLMAKNAKEFKNLRTQKDKF